MQTGLDQSKKDTRRRTMLVSVKSREQLLVETKVSSSDDGKRIEPRRTKIIASISDNTNNYERVSEMIEAGVNCLNLNMAYSQSQDAIMKISQIRDRIESEQDAYIPLNLMLKGKQIRVGSLKHPEIFLKKGTKLRLTQDKRIVGDQNIISIDDETFFDAVHLGNKIVMDYGQVVVEVESIEDSEQSLAYLMETYPDLYANTNVFRGSSQQNDLMKMLSSGSDTEKHSKHEKESFDMHDSSDLHNLQQIHLFGSESIIPECKQSLRKLKFSSAIQKQKVIKQTRKYRVLVCVVQGDCIMRPLRPVFLLNQADWMDSPQSRSKKLFKPKSQNNFYYQPDKIIETDSDSENEDSQITSQDIIYIKKAKKYGFDSITISNIHKQQDIEELREIIGKDSNIRVIVRITTIKGVQNFNTIAKYADGCMLARAYLAVQSMIEGVVQQQFDMIKIAHGFLKPIIISSQILESMITSLIPTFSEMGDISNLVNEDVDSILLTGETTYGSYPVQCISTLDRVCRQVETYQRKRRQTQYLDRDYYLSLKSDRSLVSNTVAQAVVDAAYRIKAAMIVVFTSTGSTAVKITKLKPPVPIVTVASCRKVARQLQIVGGIIATTFETLYGTEILFQKVIDQFVQSGMLSKGQYVVIISGQVENVSGQLNTMRIIQV